jgi:hypothetical protein
MYYLQRCPGEDNVVPTRIASTTLHLVKQVKQTKIIRNLVKKGKANKILRNSTPKGTLNIESKAN